MSKVQQGKTLLYCTPKRSLSLPLSLSIYLCVSAALKPAAANLFTLSDSSLPSLRSDHLLIGMESTSPSKSNFDLENDLSKEDGGDDEIDVDLSEEECGANEIEEDLGEEEIGDEQGTQNLLSANEKVAPPKVGMLLNSLNDLYQYYKQYGKQEGFGVTKLSKSYSADGKYMWITISCSRAGKMKSVKLNPLKPNPMTKTGCKARVNCVVSRLDGTCKVNSIVFEHNHGLCHSEPHLFSRNREINKATQRKLKINDQAGISMIGNFNSMVPEYSGYENIPFTEKDCCNFMEKARHSCLGVGDGQALVQYFQKAQAKNKGFFYCLDIDENDRIKNVFWADSRSRAAYASFCDVVTLDTAYLTNKYDIPLASFTGVNHHNQSILLGCGLISNEDIPTFVWLFNAFLSCMDGCMPNAIITDQDKAMKKAIELVFPTSRHRWCIWHIMKKIPEKLRGYSEYEALKYDMQNVVYDTLTKEAFESSWGCFIQKFNLQDNAWLSSLYEERSCWVPAFVRETFWAGMSSTQRNESMNAFFDGYVNSKTSLKQFVQQYDSALRIKIEKETQADFKDFSSIIPCVTQFPIEKKFQGVYTSTMFKQFQEELVAMLYCVEHPPTLLTEGVWEISVLEWVFIDGVKKQCKFPVIYNERNVDVCCACHLFEFKGILCRHVLTVLVRKGIEIVPMKYILPRWRKDLKRHHTKIKVDYDGWCGSDAMIRFDGMLKKFELIGDHASEDQQATSIVHATLDGLMETLRIKYFDTSGTKSTGLQDAFPVEETIVHGPVMVRRDGRPPTTRKVYKFEQSVKKARKEC
ncbi:protein FAR1-RELATED SEQUENCE 6-like [Malania oleifera]|uniref:protein FAR1-RELATED SEQUENCE 6-like n=1 Tax=Malania oleifera TaxID=397392 RepID=UPI0025AECD2E|nr:protein FAR1-RELATED SEQUENCE 6-like [Malania oleifera]